MLLNINMLNFYNLKSFQDEDEIETDNPNFDKHEMHLNHYCIIGPTGAGKSNCVLNLLRTLDDCFTDIQIYTSDPDEKLYRKLKEKNKHITVEKLDKIPNLSEQRGRDQKLIIFDDFIVNKNKAIIEKIDDYAFRSRKQGFTCVFLTQSYFETTAIIRSSCRYMVLLRVGDKNNFNNIIRRIDTEVEPNVLKKVIRNASKEELNFAVIDLQFKDVNKMIRKNYGLNYYTLIDENDELINNPALFNGSGIINLQKRKNK